MSTDLFLVLLLAFIVVAGLGWEMFALYTNRKLITTAARSWGPAAALLFGLVIGLLAGHFWL